MANVFISVFQLLYIFIIPSVTTKNCELFNFKIHPFLMNLIHFYYTLHSSQARSHAIPPLHHRRRRRNVYGNYTPFLEWNMEILLLVKIRVLSP